MVPGGLLEVSWRPLGAFEEAWSAKGRLPGAYGALQDASWRPSGPKSKVGIGSWPAQGHQGDWFRIAWGPNTLPKRTREGPKIEVPKRSRLKMAKP